MKDTDCVMKILEIWTTLIGLKEKTRRDYADSSGTNQKKQIIYQQLFELHLKYQHQVD